MVTRTVSSPIDLQQAITGAAKLEVKALLAGIEYVQVWISQAAKLSNIASDTLRAIEDKKGSLSETARRLTDFGRDNAAVFGDLYSRQSKSYFDELGRLTAAFDGRAGQPSRRGKSKRTASPAKTVRRAAARRKKLAAGG
jgi:hypothetical protein